MTLRSSAVFEYSDGDGNQRRATNVNRSVTHIMMLLSTDGNWEIHSMKAERL